MYKLKCSYSGGAFAVPNEIPDKYLKLAPAASFKVLLFVFRNPECCKDEEQISLCTGLTVSDVKEYLDYWIDKGILEKDNVINEEKANEAIGNMKITGNNTELPKGKKEEIKFVKPTQKVVAQRLSEEPEIKAISDEAQLLLGSFGFSMQQVIVVLYDYYGFSPEIILTLIQYQSDIKNPSPNAVEKRAEDWAKREINTMELVTEEIRSLNILKDTYTKVAEELNIPAKKPSASVSRFLRGWCIDWSFTADVIIYALKENGRSFSEANKSLKKWMQMGITALEDIKKKEKKNISKKQETTYDINNIGKNSVLDMIKQFENE